MISRWRASVLHGALACLVLATGAADASAAGVFRTVDIEGIRVIVDAEWPGQLGPGYVPVRFDISNLGEPRTIRIVGQGNRNFSTRGRSRTVFTPYMRSSSTQMEQEVVLARGARVRVTWAVPVVGMYESVRLHLQEGDRRMGEIASFNVSGTTGPDAASALIVATAGTPLAERAQKWLRGIRARGYVAPSVPPGVVVTPGGTVTSVAGGRAVPVAPRADMVLPPERLPSTWLGYSTLRAGAIGGDEWKALDDAQQSALRTWVAAGGDLLMVDGATDLVLPGREPTENDAADAPMSHLFGHVHALRSDMIADEAAFDAVVTAIPSNGRDGWRLPANRASDWDQMSRNFRLPIPEIGEVRARAFLAILAIFAIVIGPVNYLFLQRWRRQALLVVTAPLISIAFVFLLGAYVVAGEGFGVHSRIASLTMLDQSGQQAATRAIVSMYAAGRAPSGGLVFARDAAVLPALGENVPELVALDVGGGQRFSAGLLPARTPTSFEVITVGPARQRLVVTRTTDGALEVANGLGATMTSLVVRDRDGAWQLPAPVVAGGTAVLRRGQSSLALVSPEHPAFFRFEEIGAERPGTYVATLTASPFVDAGLEHMQEHESVHVVLGHLETVP